ncbi:ABC transporter permease [Curtobacterium sp. MCJR17_043]|uniref:ABC transporter permease n=1 Tax=Curtobacterium sp. MCJR17_043 TaxID=2175660 RepID=UPI0024DFB808|nr:ABC transporter permease [Curtobacterium sp. MCJR17_043]WIB36917.1 ABC transporter permease [Curtobacterium sp. MCJR17_043]
MSSTTVKAPSRSSSFTKFLANNGALVGLVVLCIALFIATPDFLTGRNLLNIGIQVSTVAVLAFGVTFVIVAGGIDLSVGSVAALSAMVSGWFFATAGLPGWLALVGGLVAGLATGVVNGLASAYGKLPSFIATLAMLSVARGLTLVLSDGKPVPTSPPGVVPRQ